MNASPRFDGVRFPGPARACVCLVHRSPALATLADRRRQHDRPSRTRRLFQATGSDDKPTTGLKTDGATLAYRLRVGRFGRKQYSFRRFRKFTRSPFLFDDTRRLEFGRYVSSTVYENATSFVVSDVTDACLFTKTRTNIRRPVTPRDATETFS